MKSYFKLKYSTNNIKNIITFSFPIFNIRHLSSKVYHGYNNKRNPFRKRNIFKNDDEKKVDRICVSILGNGAVGQPRCVGVFTDYKGFLFNCGEGVGRLCREYEITIPHIKYLFVTQKTWRNMSGLSDIFITNAIFSVPKINIYGPPGVEYFTSMFSSVQTSIALSKKDCYCDETMEINSIPIRPHVSKALLKVGAHKDDSETVFSYVCKIFGKLGEFSSEKCVDLGVPFGPHLLKLKNGEDVVLPSGRLIRSADVLNSPQSTINLLIVDCPSQAFLDPLVNEKTFSKFQSSKNKVSSDMTYVFHFAPVHIFNSVKYRTWMKKFHPNTEHFALNASNCDISSNAVCQTQNLLHLLHPKIFKLLPGQITPPEQKSTTTSSAPLKIMNPPPMLQLQLRPETKFIWSNVVSNQSKDFMQLLQESPEFIQKLDELKHFLSTDPQFEGSDVYPEVLFLGTSSAASTPCRNVTCILVNIDSTRSVVLDCGEGTFQQLIRYYGKDSIDSILQRISCVFISHRHTDHYLGLFELIKARMEAFENSGIIYQPMAVIMPFNIVQIFNKFCHLYEPLQQKIKIFICKHLVSRDENHGILQNFLGDVELKIVPVKHCPDAYGAVLNLGSNWKIVYSGDTAPCQSLIDAGQDCDLLIHEASLEENLVSEATEKLHSTSAQVIETAEKMNAQFTIMTHFSKRYLAVPVSVLENYDDKNIGCAFDFMKVRLQDLPTLPLFLPVLSCLFQEEVETHMEKSTQRVRCENVFLRVCRSLQSR